MTKEQQSKFLTELLIRAEPRGEDILRRIRTAERNRNLSGPNRIKLLERKLVMSGRKDRAISFLYEMKHKIALMIESISSDGLNSLEEELKNEFERLSDWFGIRYSGTRFLDASREILVARLNALANTATESISILNNSSRWPYYGFPNHDLYRNKGEKKWIPIRGTFGTTFHDQGIVQFAKNDLSTEIIEANRPFVAFWPNYFETTERELSTLIHETIHVLLGSGHPLNKHPLGRTPLKFSFNDKPLPIEDAMLKPESWGAYVLGENPT